jgi:hypothetical protein
MGAEFQREDEFGVFGLHVWVWRNNPNGLFEEAHPRISCGTIGWRVGHRLAVRDLRSSFASSRAALRNHCPYERQAP